MKKVWILERYISPEETKESLNGLYEMRNAAKGNDDLVKTCDMAIEIYKKRMEENPDGYWLGYQGKTVYRQFCECAKETMRNPKLKGSSYRVIEAEIPDAADTWSNYQIVKVNEGVLRYLYATL